MSLFDEIPEYRAALNLETEQRDAAFLQLPLAVPRKWPRPPLVLLPITIRRMLILEHAKSPFICGGGETTAGAIAQFLWVCSPGFSADRKARDRFIRQCRTVNASAALETIRGMVNAAFYDSPPREKSSGESPSYWSLAASLVDCLASEYGWTQGEILDTPLASVLQYFKVIQHRKSASAGERAPLFNPSDSVKARWLETVNAKGGGNAN